MAKSRRVVVAMSGGVDSSVAAALLKEQGYDVIGMMLRLWSEPGKEDSNRCCTPDAMALARRVAAHLGIPFYAVDAQDVFYKHVVTEFVNGYERGVTPIPCLVCNSHIRFRYLLDRALALGADFLATGHYARMLRDKNDLVHLLRGIDHQKDQSYVLHVLNQEQLNHALFPVGEYSKPKVREVARQFNLPIAERPDSQDLCFLAGEDYRQFLLRKAPQVVNPGPIVTTSGETIGHHQGLAFYTIGQRKGLGISNPIPLYVIKKDIQNNILVIGTVEEMGQRNFRAEAVNWISGSVPPEKLRAQVKIRYKAQEAWANIVPLPEMQVKIILDEPLRDITPGQAAVFYNGEECLGGGIISEESEL
jgi:tRNA-uridine 2-sulfurtransferase